MAEKVITREHRIMEAARSRMGGIHIILENLEDVGNRAAILRSVEAFGFLNVHEVGTENLKLNNRSRSIVNGGEKWLVVEKYDSIRSCVEYLKSNKGVVKVLATVPPNRCVNSSVEGKSISVTTSIHAIDFSPPTAIVFGNEKCGVSEELLVNFADENVTIPMYGLSESFNVSVAAAVVLNIVREKRRVALALDGNQGDLNPDDLATLTLDYLDRGRETHFQAGVRDQRSLQQQSQSED